MLNYRFFPIAGRIMFGFLLYLSFDCHSLYANNHTGNPLLSPRAALQQPPLPDFAAVTDTEQKKQQFFDFLQPQISRINLRIESERAWLVLVYQTIEQGETLAYWQQQMLGELHDYYRVAEPIASSAAFEQLMLRVDTIPASLVLAQAANESAWGTSRFAVEGNNLFGQWCFSQGCGLVPTGRDSDASHEVRVFDSVADSVDSYFRNLNTHRQYAAFRALRAQSRDRNELLNSTELVWGIKGYSSRGDLYITELIDMIRYNALQQYDQPAFYASQPIQIKADG